MNTSVLNYYQKSSNIEGVADPFFEVKLIDDQANFSWDQIHEMAPVFTKGWFELTQLCLEDRIEFTKHYWLNALPYKPRVHEFFETFFSKIEDVAVFMTKSFPSSPYVVEMVYSLKDDKGFFRGQLPIDDEMIRDLNRSFGDILPYDYLAFLRIHNGFSKLADTGIIAAEEMKNFSERIQAAIFYEGATVHCNKKVIDPTALIPFYQCFGRDSYQCFYTDWYPSSEMGNVYYSASDQTVSDYRGISSMSEHLSFPSFLDWLMFYLEETKI